MLAAFEKWLHEGVGFMAYGDVCRVGVESGEGSGDEGGGASLVWLLRLCCAGLPSAWHMFSCRLFMSGVRCCPQQAMLQACECRRHAELQGWYWLIGGPGLGGT